MASAPELDLEGLGALGVDGALIARRERLDGERALRFLGELPALAAHWQERLGLIELRIMPGGVLSAALSCRRRVDASHVVLKLSSPWPEPQAASARAEAAALNAWQGVGACALLYASEDASALLLDAIRPGAAVRPGDHRQDAARAGALLRTLHRIAPERIPRAVPDATQELEWRFERAHRQLDGPSHARGFVGHRDLDAAYRAALALHAQRATSVLCHGDFINKNILLDGEGSWRAIDPRPCAGDPCLDAAFWSLTHRPGEGVGERCDLVAGAAGLDPARVRAWARAFAVSEAVLVTDVERARAHCRVLAGAGGVSA